MMRFDARADRGVPPVTQKEEAKESRVDFTIATNRMTPAIVK